MSSVILVPFRGPGAGVSDLSWGQQEIWAAMRAQESSLAGGSVAPLGEGQGIDYAVALLGHLMSRFPSFRTRLRFAADGTVAQVLADQGEARLRIVDAPDDADPERVAWTVRDEYVTTVFDYVDEWPIRMAVIRHRGVPTHLVAVHCHLALDAGGFRTVAADLARFPDVDMTDQEPAHDPLEQVRWQQSEAGQRQHATVARHWRRLLNKVATERFGHTDDEQRPRHWRVTGNLPAAYVAMRAIAHRLGQPDTSPVLMAAVAMALSQVTGVDPTVLQVIVNNRFRADLATTASPVAQSALCAINVADRTFDEVVDRAWRSLMSAYLNAYYDPHRMDELIAEIGRERGAEIDLDCFFNDRRDQPRREYSGPPPTKAELDAARGRTTLDWGPHSDAPAPRFYVHVLDTPDTIELITFADTRYLPPGDITRFLTLFETILVESAFDPTTPSDIADSATTAGRP
ncbi:MAG TPA: condensation domain-containing protein [Pseudonocardiaceae bacterium]